MDGTQRGFKERLKEKVMESRYNQKQLAELVGVTEVALSRYMTGERVPKPQVLANMATALQTTSEYLLTGKEPFADYEDLYALIARSAGEFSNEQIKELSALLKKINKRMEGN